MRDIMAAESEGAPRVTHDVLAAVIGTSRQRVSDTLRDDSDRTLSLDHVALLLASPATRDVAVELLRSLIATSESASDEHGDDLHAQVLSLLPKLNEFERNAWSVLRDPGHLQLSFLISGGELCLKGVGSLVNSGRRVKARRGR